MRFALATCCMAFILIGVACSDGDGNEDIDTTNTPGAASATETPDPGATPANAAFLDDVIDLAVQLDTMTREQAVCVFQDHPSIYQEFLQESGLMTSGTVDEARLRQQIEDLKREHAVQLDVCFQDLGG